MSADGCTSDDGCGTSISAIWNCTATSSDSDDLYDFSEETPLINETKPSGSQDWIKSDDGSLDPVFLSLHSTTPDAEQPASSMPPELSQLSTSEQVQPKPLTQDDKQACKLGTTGDRYENQICQSDETEDRSDKQVSTINDTADESDKQMCNIIDTIDRSEKQICSKDETKDGSYKQICNMGKTTDRYDYKQICSIDETKYASGKQIYNMDETEVAIYKQICTTAKMKGQFDRQIYDMDNAVQIHNAVDSKHLFDENIFSGNDTKLELSFNNKGEDRSVDETEVKNVLCGSLGLIQESYAVHADANMIQEEVEPINLDSTDTTLFGIQTHSKVGGIKLTFTKHKGLYESLQKAREERIKKEKAEKAAALEKAKREAQWLMSRKRSESFDNDRSRWRRRWTRGNRVSDGYRDEGRRWKNRASRHRSRSRSRSRIRTRYRSQSKSRRTKRYRSKSRTRDRSRSKSRTRNRSRSKTRERSRSKSRQRSRSRTRQRSRSKSRQQRRSRARNRSRSKSRMRNRSRSRSRQSSRSRTRHRSRSKSEARNRSRSRGRYRGRSKSRTRNRSRSKSRTRNRSRSKSRTRNRSRNKSRSRSKTRNRSRSRTRKRSRSKIRHRSKSRTRNRTRSKSKEGNGSRSRSMSESKPSNRNKSRSRSKSKSRSSRSGSSAKNSCERESKDTYLSNNNCHGKYGDTEYNDTLNRSENNDEHDKKDQNLKTISNKGNRNSQERVPCMVEKWESCVDGSKSKGSVCNGESSSSCEEDVGRQGRCKRRRNSRSCSSSCSSSSQSSAGSADRKKAKDDSHNSKTARISSDRSSRNRSRSTDSMEERNASHNIDKIVSTESQAVSNEMNVHMFESEKSYTNESETSTDKILFGAQDNHETCNSETKKDVDSRLEVCEIIGKQNSEVIRRIEKYASDYENIAREKTEINAVDVPAKNVKDARVKECAQDTQRLYSDTESNSLLSPDHSSCGDTALDVSDINNGKTSREIHEESNQSETVPYIDCGAVSAQWCQHQGNSDDMNDSSDISSSHFISEELETNISSGISSDNRITLDREASSGRKKNIRSVDRFAAAGIVVNVENVSVISKSEDNQNSAMQSAMDYAWNIDSNSVDIKAKITECPEGNKGQTESMCSQNFPINSDVPSTLPTIDTHQCSAQPLQMSHCIRDTENRNIKEINRKCKDHPSFDMEYHLMFKNSSYPKNVMQNCKILKENLISDKHAPEAHMPDAVMPLVRVDEFKDPGKSSSTQENYPNKPEKDNHPASDTVDYKVCSGDNNCKIQKSESDDSCSRDSLESDDNSCSSHSCESDDSCSRQSCESDNHSPGSGCVPDDTCESDSSTSRHSYKSEDSSTRASCESVNTSSSHSCDSKDSTSRHSCEVQDSYSRHICEPRDRFSRYSCEKNESSPRNIYELKNSPCRHSCEPQESSSRHSFELQDISSRHSCEPEDSPSRQSCEPKDSPSRHSCDLRDSSSRDSCEPQESSSSHICELQESSSRHSYEAVDYSSRHGCDLKDSSSSNSYESNDRPSRGSCEQSNCSSRYSFKLKDNSPRHNFNRRENYFGESCKFREGKPQAVLKVFGLIENAAFQRMSSQESQKPVQPQSSESNFTQLLCLPPGDSVDCNSALYETGEISEHQVTNSLENTSEDKLRFLNKQKHVSSDPVIYSNRHGALSVDSSSENSSSTGESGSSSEDESNSSSSDSSSSSSSGSSSSSSSSGSSSDSSSSSSDSEDDSSSSSGSESNKVSAVTSVIKHGKPDHYDKQHDKMQGESELSNSSQSPEKCKDWSRPVPNRSSSSVGWKQIQKGKQQRLYKARDIAFDNTKSDKSLKFRKLVNNESSVISSASASDQGPGSPIEPQGIMVDSDGQGNGNFITVKAQKTTLPSVPVIPLCAPECMDYLPLLTNMDNKKIDDDGGHDADIDDDPYTVCTDNNLSLFTENPNDPEAQEIQNSQHQENQKLQETPVLSDNGNEALKECQQPEVGKRKGSYKCRVDSAEMIPKMDEMISDTPVSAEYVEKKHVISAGLNSSENVKSYNESYSYPTNNNVPLSLRDKYNIPSSDDEEEDDDDKYDLDPQNDLYLQILGIQSNPVPTNVHSFKDSKLKTTTSSVENQKHICADKLTGMTVSTDQKINEKVIGPNDNKFMCDNKLGNYDGRKGVACQKEQDIMSDEQFLKEGTVSDINANVKKIRLAEKNGYTKERYLEDSVQDHVEKCPAEKKDIDVCKPLSISGLSDKSRGDRNLNNTTQTESNEVISKQLFNDFDSYQDNLTKEANKTLFKTPIVMKLNTRTKRSNVFLKETTTSTEHGSSRENTNKRKDKENQDVETEENIKKIKSLKSSEQDASCTRSDQNVLHDSHRNENNADKNVVNDEEREMENNEHKRIDENDMQDRNIEKITSRNRNSEQKDEHSNSRDKREYIDSEKYSRDQNGSDRDQDKKYKKRSRDARRDNRRDKSRERSRERESEYRKKSSSRRSYRSRSRERDTRYKDSYRSRSRRSRSKERRSSRSQRSRSKERYGSYRDKKLYQERHQRDLQAYKEYLYMYCYYTKWRVQDLVPVEECPHRTEKEAEKCDRCKGHCIRIPAGYCFVEFPDAEQAKLAMLKLNGKEVPGSQPSKRFKLNHASYGREHKTVPEYSLYVGDLSSEVDDLQLYQVFAKRYQSCRAATVLKDQRGESKGFGFVRFTDDTERRQALYEMQRYNGLGKKEIRVSLAMSRSRITPGSVPTTNVNQYRQFEGQNYYWQHYQSPYYNQTWGQSQGYDYYGNHQADPSQYQQTYHHHMEAHEDDNELEDPCLDVDVDKLNKEFMERSEELYMALEGSRWHPLDNVFSPVTPKVD